MKRKEFGHLICSRKTEDKYLLLYRATNEYLAARKLLPVSKTEFTDRLIDSISVEHLAGKIIQPLYRHIKKRPGKWLKTVHGYKLVLKNGERYFVKKKAGGLRK